VTARILPFPATPLCGSQVSMRSIEAGYGLILEVLSDHGDRSPEVGYIVDVPALRHDVDSHDGAAALRVLEIHAEAPLPHVRVQLLEFSGAFGRIDYSLDELTGVMALTLLEPR
jgi:hypothetical protein